MAAVLSGRNEEIPLKVKHEDGTIETFNTTSGGTVRLKIPDAIEPICYLSNLVKENIIKSHSFDYSVASKIWKELLIDVNSTSS